MARAVHPERINGASEPAPADTVHPERINGASEPAPADTFFVSRKSCRAAVVESRKEQFLARHGEEAAARYRTQTDTIARQIRARERRMRFVLQPNTNRFLGYWDIVSFLALLYTSTVTPFEASFIPPTYGDAVWQDPWYLLNRVLDAIFAFDMFLQFFIAYEELDERGSVVFVADSTKIVKHYLRTWFSLDAGTIFVPGAFDYYMAGLDLESAGGGDITSRMSIFRVLRIIRLVKLLRLLRASRLYNRWKSKISMNYGQRMLILCVSVLFLSAHWYACIMALQASLHSSPEATWLGPSRYNICDGTAGEAITGVEGCGELAIGSFYLAAFSWSMMIITGTGGTDFYPSEVSDGETIIVTSLVVVGALLWTQVLAMFCDIATNSDPGLTQFRQDLDSLNTFVKANNLPREMACRMREYLHQQQAVQLAEYTTKALPRLSTALQIEVVLHCHQHWLDKVFFLRGLDDLCRVRLAMAMNAQVLAPGEVAAQGKLYVVSRGLVLFGGRVLGTGAVWGDDVILSYNNYFLPHLARAMSYVDVYTITRESLTRNVANFPASMARLRRHTIFLALRRHLILAVKQAKDAKASGAVGDERESGQADMIDRSLKEAVPSDRSTKLKSVNMAVEFEAMLKQTDEGSEPSRTSPMRRMNHHRGGGSSEAGASSAELAIIEMQGQMREMHDEIRGVARAVEAITATMLSASASKRQATLPRCASLTYSRPAEAKVEEET